MTYAIQAAHADQAGFRIPARIVSETQFSVCAAFTWPGEMSERAWWFDRHSRQMRGLDGSNAVTLVEGDE